MAIVAGINGGVKIGANWVAGVKSWSADIQWATEDTTAFDGAAALAKWAQNLLTVRSISGSVECVFDGADTNGQVALLNEMFTTGDGSVTLVLYPHTGAVALTVPALITGASINSSATGVAGATFSFVQSGATAPSIAYA